jgi:hypothetical protein
MDCLTSGRLAEKAAGIGNTKVAPTSTPPKQDGKTAVDEPVNKNTTANTLTPSPKNRTVSQSKIRTQDTSTED